MGIELKVGASGDRLCGNIEMSDFLNWVAAQPNARDGKYAQVLSVIPAGSRYHSAGSDPRQLDPLIEELNSLRELQPPARLEPILLAWRKWARRARRQKKALRFL